MDSKKNDKRVVPGWLKIVLSKDAMFTKYFVESTNNNSVFDSLKNHNYMFEISCNVLVWLSVILAAVWTLAIPSLYQLQANLFLALLLDVVLVAILKGFTRRRGPKHRESYLDKYSFPSGLASRSALVMYIFLFIYQVPLIIVPPIMAWTVSVCVSRILIEKHFILDVAGGVLIGIFQGILWSVLWLSTEVSQYIISYISDENFVGAEYHV